MPCSTRPSAGTRSERRPNTRLRAWTLDAGNLPLAPCRQKHPSMPPQWLRWSRVAEQAACSRPPSPGAAGSCVRQLATEAPDRDSHSTHQVTQARQRWQSEVEAYLRKIGPTIPALAQAVAMFGPGVLRYGPCKPRSSERSRRSVKGLSCVNGSGC